MIPASKPPRLRQSLGRPGFLTALVAFVALALGPALPLQAQAPVPVPATIPGAPKPQVTVHPIWSPEREALTREYFSIHGDGPIITLDPKILVIHYTGSRSDAEGLRVFRAPRLEGRADIIAGGALNVGVHWVITRDGSLHAFLPEHLRGRHIIGYNHVSLGIELVGDAESALTEAQFQALVALVRDLGRRHPGLAYLIGHHEFLDDSLPHRPLWLENDPAYRPGPKVDPGPRFMARLRQALDPQGHYATGYFPHQ